MRRFSAGELGVCGRTPFATCTILTADRDNSTRGLDSANAIEFCNTLRTQCDVFGTSAFVAIYQAPQAAYDVGPSNSFALPLC